MKKITILSVVILMMILAASRANQSTAAGNYRCPPCGGACDNIFYSQGGQCPDCGMQLIIPDSQKTVAIFVYEGVEILDFSGPSEVFASAGFRVFAVAATKDPVISQGFLKIQPEFSIDDCPRPDIIVLPGGNTRASVENPRVIDWVKGHEPHLDAALSVCTGAFILEKAGLLNGKKATTWYGAIGKLRELATQTEVLEHVRWVDNGRIVTTAGVSAGIDGALRVVERMLGREKALATAKYMEYDKWDPANGLIVAERK